MTLTPEELLERQREGGRKGGKAKNKNKGFGSSKERAREAGSKGAKTRWNKEG